MTPITNINTTQETTAAVQILLPAHSKRLYARRLSSSTETSVDVGCCGIATVEYDGGAVGCGGWASISVLATEAGDSVRPGGAALVMRCSRSMSQARASGSH